LDGLVRDRLAVFQIGQDRAALGDQDRVQCRRFVEHPAQVDAAPLGEAPVRDQPVAPQDRLEPVEEEPPACDGLVGDLHRWQQVRLVRPGQPRAAVVGFLEDAAPVLPAERRHPEQVLARLGHARGLDDRPVHQVHEGAKVEEGAEPQRRLRRVPPRAGLAGRAVLPDAPGLPVVVAPALAGPGEIGRLGAELAQPRGRQARRGEDVVEARLEAQVPVVREKHVGQRGEQIAEGPQPGRVALVEADGRDDVGRARPGARGVGQLGPGHRDEEPGDGVLRGPLAVGVEVETDRRHPERKVEVARRHPANFASANIASAGARSADNCTRIARKASQVTGSGAGLSGTGTRTKRMPPPKISAPGSLPQLFARPYR
jgi:hypothetical protein